MREYIFTTEFDSVSMQDYLRREKGFSASQIRRLKQMPECVNVNGSFRRMVDPINKGDVICLTIIDNKSSATANHTLHAGIAYQDSDIIVFDKPYNMPVHRSPRHRNDTLENVFAAVCEKQDNKIPFRPINRLDRDTTGLCVVAKTAVSAHALGSCLVKEYIALVSGIVPESGVIDAPIERASDSIILRRVGESGQKAVTAYTRIYCKNNLSLVRFHLQTGRTHQIRVHMAHLGHPLLGDELYGGDMTLINRQALHCSAVSFNSPIGKKTIRIQSELPDDMKNTFTEMKNEKVF